MRYEQIKEGVEYGDLETLVDSTVSVAEFKPKQEQKKMLLLLDFMGFWVAPPITIQ